MPIPTPTANAALSIVSTLVRLTGRIDSIMAEQAALRADLAFAGKVEVRPPMVVHMVRDLETFLASTAGRTPDPLQGRREELRELLARQPPPERELIAWMERLVPEKLVFEIVDPAGTFAAKLQSKREAWSLDDEDIRRLVYYLAPGDDTRQDKLPWQLAMSVVEGLTDIAVANQGLLLRDDRARPLVLAVLERFASEDLAAGPPRTTLRLVLKATLNGALDAADNLGSDKAWVNGLLSALANAREKSGDDFVVGLIRGRGYPLLVGELLAEGSRFLSSGDASHFERIAADVLDRAGRLSGERSDFAAFFQDHWGDLLRAGLRSVHSHGNAILGTQSPLLRETLLASVGALAHNEDAAWLGSGTLVAAVEAGVAAVAAKPQLLERTDPPWLGSLLGSVAAVVADQGIRTIYGSDGLHALVEAALADFAAHPELLIDEPGLPQKVLGTMLKALEAGAPRRVKAVAAAGVTAVLAELAANPALVQSKYPDVIADIARRLGAALGDLTIDEDEARVILGGAASAIAKNPAIIGADESELPGAVLAAVLASLVGDGGRLVPPGKAAHIAVAALDAAIAHPKLLAGKPELAAAAIEAVLGAVRDAVGDTGPNAKLTAARVAATAARAVLEAVAANPQLLDSAYAAEVGRIAALLAASLGDGKISGEETDAIVTLTARIVASNAPLFAEARPALAADVLNAVLETVLADGALRLRGTDLATITAAVLDAVAAHGIALIGSEPVTKLIERISTVVEVGLAAAARQLGVLLDRRAAAAVIAELVRRWASDRVPTLDSADPRFDPLFAEIVGKVLERAA